MTILEYSEEGLPIKFDEETDCFIYKDSIVPFKKVKTAVDSGYSSHYITDNLDYTLSPGYVTFGCLELTKEKFNQIFKQAWKLSKMYNKVGN